MAYVIRYKPRAKQQLEQCREDYGTFTASVEEWLRGLANAAERQDKTIAFELGNAVEVVASGVESPSSWAESFRRWVEAPGKTKLKALLATLRKLCPPWELLSSGAPLPFLGHGTCEVHVHYLVDHVGDDEHGKKIVVALFKGLPGQ